MPSQGTKVTAVAYLSEIPVVRVQLIHDADTRRISVGKSVELVLDPLFPATVCESQIFCCNLTVGDRREQTGLDEGPDVHATISIMIRLDLDLQLTDFTQVISTFCGPKVGLKFDLPVPHFYIRVDGNSLGSNTLDDIPKGNSPVEELEHIGDQISCRDNNRLHHDKMLGIRDELLNMRIPTLSGRAFQPEAGHRSDVKPATIPINIRPL